MRSNSYENGPNVPSLIIAFTISNGMLAKLVIHLVTLVMTGCTVDSTTHGTSMTLHKKSFPYTGRPICWLLYSIINARNVCSIYDTIIKLIFYDAYMLRAQKGLLLTSWLPGFARDPLSLPLSSLLFVPAFPPSLGLPGFAQDNCIPEILFFNFMLRYFEIWWGGWGGGYIF